MSSNDVANKQLELPDQNIFLGTLKAYNEYENSIFLSKFRFFGQFSVFFFFKSFMYDCYTLIYHALLGENYLSNGKDCLIMNHLILMVIFFKIYKRKLNDINPTLGFLWQQILKQCTILRKKIVTKNDKLYKHYKKWEKQIPYAH